MVFASVLHAQQPYWEWAIGGEGDETSIIGTANFLAKDQEGNWYLVGRITGSKLQFGDTELENPQTDPSAYLAKFNSSNQLQWVVVDTETLPPAGMSVSEAGVYVVYVENTAQSLKSIIKRYDPADGSQQGLNETLDNVHILSLHASDDKLYAAGIFRTTITFGSSSLDPSQHHGCLLYFSANQPQAAYGFGVPLPSSQGISMTNIVVKASPNDNSRVFVGGALGNASNSNVSFSFGADVVTANANGRALFALEWNNSGGAEVSAIVLQTSIGGSVLRNLFVKDGLFMLGTFGSINPFGGNEENKAFVVKYNLSTGNMEWNRLLDHDVRIGLSGEMDDDGNIFVAHRADIRTQTLMTKVEPSSANTSVLADYRGGAPSSFIINDDLMYMCYEHPSVWMRSALNGALIDYITFGGSLPVSNELATSVCTDASGNVYVAGEYYSYSLVMGEYTLLSKGPANTFVAKYNKQGDLLWAVSLGDDFGALRRPTIHIYGDHLYVSGDYGGGITDLQLPFGRYVMKLNADDGSKVWVRGYGSGLSRLITNTGLAVGPTGVYAACLFFSNQFSNTLSFASDNLLLTVPSMAFVRYSHDGEELSVVLLNSSITSFIFANSMVLDANNKLWVAITLPGTINFGNNSYNSSGAFLARYEPDLTPDWADALPASMLNAVAVDGDEAYVVGYGAFFSAPPPPNSTSVYIVKYTNAASANPQMAWSKEVTNDGNFLSVSGEYIALAGDLVWIGGYFQEGGGLVHGNTTLASAGGWDVFLLSYDKESGDEVAATRWGNGGDDLSFGIAAAADNEEAIYVAGYSNSASIEIDDATWVNSGSTGDDFFLARMQLYYEVKFVILDTDNNPIENAEINIFNRTLMSDAAGEASLLLPSGTHSYSVLASGFQSVSDVLEVDRQDKIVTVVLERVYLVTFIVTYSNEGVQGVEITINNQTISTDSNGEASILLPNGTYTYSVSAPVDYNPVPDGEVEVNSVAQSIQISLVRNPLGADMRELSGIELYPNPASHTLLIRSQQGAVSIRLMDLRGRELYRSSLMQPEHSVDVSGYQSGIYLIEVEGNGIRQVSRVIKQ